MVARMLTRALPKINVTAHALILASTKLNAVNLSCGVHFESRGPRGDELWRARRYRYESDTGGHKITVHLTRHPVTRGYPPMAAGAWPACAGVGTKDDIDRDT